MKRKLTTFMAAFFFLIAALAYAITGSLDADQEAGDWVRVPAGESVQYTVTPDESESGFVGTAYVEKSANQLTSTIIDTITGTEGEPEEDALTGTFVNHNTLLPVWIRVRIEDIDTDAPSDALDWEIAAQADTVLTAKIEQGKVTAPDGTVLMHFKTTGVEIPSLTTEEGGIAGTLTPDVLILPDETTASQTAEGSAVWQTSNDVLTIGTGSGRKTMVDLSTTQTITGSKTFSSIHITGGTAVGLAMDVNKQRVWTSDCKVGATAGWAIAAAADTWRAATLPAGQTASTLVCPLNGLAIGDDIIEFNLMGQIESAGGAVTVDAVLYVATGAASDPTDTSLGAITQLAVTADTLISATNTNKILTSPHTVANHEIFYVVITATTAGSTDIQMLGVRATVQENFQSIE